MEEPADILELSNNSHHNESLYKIKKQSSPTNFHHDYDKNQEEQGHIHATPSTQNAAIDDSMILQETIKKKCISCIDTEKKLYQIEHELRAQRKKNLRYLKIINSVMKKEKELQMAYSEIAQQLKKKMDAANAREIGIQALLQNYQKQSEQLRILRQQVNYMDNILKETEQKLKTAQQRYEGLLQARQHKQQNQQKKDGLSQQKILNIFYEKQIVQLHQKINQLESQLKLQEQELRNEKLLHSKLNKMSSIKDLALKPVSSRPQLMSHQRTSNKSKRSDQKSIQNGNNFINLKEQQEIQSFKPFNMSKISSIEAKNDQSELHDIMQLHQDASFNTVSEWVQSQFHSIVHSKPFMHSQSLSLLKSKHQKDKHQEYKYKDINESEFYSIQSNSFQNEISRISDKKIDQNLKKILQISNHLSVQSQQVEEAINKKQQEYKIVQSKKDRLLDSQIIIKDNTAFIADFVQSVGNLLEKIQEMFNNAGKTYKINIQMPQLPYFSHKNSKKESHKIQDLALQTTLVNEAARKFQQQFQFIIKMIKKSYEKLLNDQQLQLAEMKSKIDQQSEEKRHLGKIVQNLQQHKLKLEYKISQTQQIPSNSLSSIRETYLRSVIKKKSSLCMNRFKEQQVQCQILSSNIEEIMALQIQNYDKIIQSIQYIPSFLNETLKKRNISCDFSVDTQKDLEPQFQDIILKALNLLKIEISSDNQTLSALKKIRRCSLSLKQIPQLQNKDKNNNYSFLHGQNYRLHENLKERTQKVMALNEKNTLLNTEKQKLEKQIKQMKQIQQKMELQIRSLKSSVIQRKQISNLVKINSQYYTKKPSIVQQNVYEQGEFVEYQEKIQFNNLYEDKDVQLKKLRELNQIYERQLKKYKTQMRKYKKKVVYINH